MADNLAFTPDLCDKPDIKAEGKPSILRDDVISCDVIELTDGDGIKEDEVISLDLNDVAVSDDLMPCDKNDVVASNEVTSGDLNDVVVSDDVTPCDVNDEYEAGDDIKKRSFPFYTASWLSRITVWWTVDVIRKTRRNKYDIDDVMVPESHRSIKITETLQSAWNQEKTNSSPSLTKAVLKAFWGDVLTLIPFSIFYAGILLSQPPMIGYVVNFLLGKPGTDFISAIFYACALVILSVIFCLANRGVFYQATLLGTKLRAAFSGIIFQKVMSIDYQTRHRVNTGRLINMMAADLEIMIQLCNMAPYLWMTPAVTIIGTILICVEFGLAGIGAAVFFFIFFIINICLDKILGKIRVQTAERTDRRVNMMNEIIMGIGVIKMYCWEKPYTKLIDTLRKRELSTLFKSLTLQGLHHSGYLLTARTAAYLVFLTHTLRGGTLTPDKAVKLIGWVEVIQMLCIAFVMSLADLMEAITSLSRIQNFLNLPEENRETEESVISYIEHENLTTSWSWNHNNELDVIVKDTTTKDGSGLFSLRCGTFACKKGDLIVVVGAVGSGKTSYLKTLLGEMTLIEGTLSPITSVAYAPQEPWVMSTSVRENVLFGSHMDKTKYDKVITACGLDQDVSRFPNRDLTLVGERGLTLSGGQKSRLTLARALYQDRLVYFMDDPLSAVDATVGEHIFSQAISGYLDGKTRVLVTHQIQFLDRADQVIVFNKGAIVFTGSPGQLKANTSYDTLTSTKYSVKENIAEKHVTQRMLQRRLSRMDTTEKIQEDSERGTVSWRVYWNYFLAGKGYIWFILYLLLAIPSQICYILSDWWLSIWTEYNEAVLVNGTVSDRQEFQQESQEYFHIKVYSGLLGMLIILAIGRQVFFFTFTKTASRNLHNSMFKYVLGTRLAFFETNPVGIILNRFSRDLGFIDILLAKLCSLISTQVLNLVSFLIFVGFVSPYALCAVVPYVIATLTLRHTVLSATREIKRMEAVRRSPIYSHVSTSLEGHTVIRAFRKEAEFLETFHDIQDKHTVSWILFISCYRFLGLWISFMSTAYMLVVIVTSFLVSNSGIEGTLVGFALIYNLVMVDMVQFIIILSAEFENTMTAVERISSYASLEPEENSQPSSNILPPNWPTKGNIEFTNVSLCYENHQNKVLDDVTFNIHDGERIGIIGRTGAGKSSIFKALLRLVETDGIITVDGAGINDLPLEVLRRSISVIPQDPVLFTGTLRCNLDPFSEFTDKSLWNVLDQVQLKDLVQSQTAGLMYLVEEGGGNFSVGQKQLVCLARAMLRNNKILIIDEATANVDLRTDVFIQDAIRTSFKSCTVLTIAHRINTIMDSDRILVMENGRVQNFDTPSNVFNEKPRETSIQSE